MIEQIRIKNFQAHKSASYTLSPVTTFVGRSDKGKSAILRALRWAVTNAPRGDGFIREGETKCKVGVKVDDHTVLRTRTASKNAYSLDGEELKAFGASTPDVVDEVFMISPASFQGQFDGPFWISLSGGQLADKLNEISDLQLVTKMVSSAGKKVKENKAELKAYESIVENAKTEVAFHEWAIEAKKDLENLEALNNQIKTKQELACKLHKQLYAAQDAMQLLSNPSVADAIKTAHKLQQLEQQLEQLHKQLYAAQDAMQLLSNPSVADAIKTAHKLQQLEQQLEQLHKQLHAAQDANETTKKPSLEPAMSDLLAIIEHCDHLEGLRHLVSVLARAAQVLQNTKEIEVELRLKHSSIKLCPTCEQPLPCRNPPTKLGTT